IHLHAQAVIRQGVRASQRGAGSQHGSDHHVESVALHALLFPNAIAIGPAGSWPLWSMRTDIFYGLSVVLWLSYFYAFFRLHRNNQHISWLTRHITREMSSISSLRSWEQFIGPVSCITP